MRHVPKAPHVVPGGQQAFEGPAVQLLPVIVPVHWVWFAGQEGLLQASGLRNETALHPQFPVSQQVSPVAQALGGLVPHRHAPSRHRSLIAQCVPQVPQFRMSDCRVTHAPPQQLGLGAGQSLPVQHRLFAMQFPSQTFWPSGQLDAHRPLAQT